MHEYTMSWSDAVRAEAAFAETSRATAPSANGDDAGSGDSPEPRFSQPEPPSAARPTRLRAFVECLRSGVR